MGMYREQLGESRVGTIVGGVLGGHVFLCFLTGISGIERELLHENFQARLFPEVALSLLGALAASVMVHRVSGTVCLLTAAGLLYLLVAISNRRYATAPPSTPAVPASASKKRK